MKRDFKTSTIFGFTFYGILLLLYSCSTQIPVSTKMYKRYAPSGNDSVIIYQKPTSIPVNYEVLGKLRIICNGDIHKDCDSISIISLAEKETQESGGNALLINRYKKPTLFNSSFQLDANILNVFDFSSAPDSFYSKKPINPLEVYNKGTVDLRLSLPYFNQFTFHTDHYGTKNPIGFLGALVGLDYYHSRKQYVSLFVGGGMNFFLPFPAPVDYSGGVEFANSIYLGLTNNHRCNRFTFGYGLSLSKDSWRYKYFGDDDLSEEHGNGVRQENQKYDGQNLGLLFSSHYSITKQFSLGIMYKPTVVRFNSNPEFRYGHLLTIDLAWRIRLKTTK